MCKKREYKTSCVGDYKITIDTCDNDVPCVMVWKHLNNDNIENIFGYYSKDVADFFLTIISKRDQQAERIAELEEQLKNAIVPKFNRQEHICGFAFGEIREYIVVAYVDNNITLCENILDGVLEWCDNNFLVRTFEEAQAKLKELTAKNV